MSRDKSDLEQTERIMAVLVRQPPKPHEEMKLGKRTAKKKAIRQQKTTKKP